jgi:hypothetical protein
MSLEITSHTSFCDWYHDESIPGHLPLRPSIWIEESCTRIFSPLPSKKKDRASEIALRIALFIALPFAALFAAFSTLIGLATKKIGETVTKRDSPSHTQETSTREEESSEGESNQTESTSSEEGSDRTSTTTSSGETESTSSDETTESDSSSSVSAPSETASQAEESFANAQRIHKQAVDRVQKDQLTEAKKLLMENPDIQKLLKDDDDENHADAKKQCQDLLNLIKSIQEKQELYSVKIDEESGGITVKSDGACLFTSFLTQANLLGLSDRAVNYENALDERKKTVKWMEKHLKTDHKLLGAMCNSLYEHYRAEMRKTKEDLKTYQCVDRVPGEKLFSHQQKQMEDQKKITRQKRDEIKPKYSKIKEIVNNSEAPNYSLLEPFIPEYLALMSQPEVFAGAAELYALSCRYKVCVKVHQNSIYEPFSTHNPQYETEKKPAFHLIYKASHYMPAIQS